MDRRVGAGNVNDCYNRGLQGGCLQGIRDLGQVFITGHSGGHFHQLPIARQLESAIDKGIDVGLVEGEMVEISDEKDAAYNINQ